MNNVVIIGGGLAGLTSSILLNRQGYHVTVIEKKNYPFHRVCGEYISNEVLPFFKSLGINPEELQPSHISRLSVSSISGKLLETGLDMGGFGISRFCFDDFLYKKASAEGVEFILGKKASDISFVDNQFEIELTDKKINASILIGAYGKRSNLDMKMERDFFYRRSPYLGVKYHIRTDFPNNKIQLDNFEGGYCGIVKIESDKYCLCYLSENRQLKKYESLAEMEEQVLFKNPFIKRYFKNSDFLFDKPEVINEISFENKSLVEDHILFCGDAAGMITPLCGNGMAIAVQSAKILSEAIIEFGSPGSFLDRPLIERAYTERWKSQFSFRLKTGRLIQKIFANRALSSAAVSALRKSDSITKFVISKTHGKPF